MRSALFAFPPGSLLFRTCTAAFFTLTVIFCMSRNAQAQNWVPATAGPFSWQTPTTNWSTGTAPNGVGATANVTANLTAAQIITLDGAVTLGTLNLGDPTTAFFGYTIQAGSGGSLTFNSGVVGTSAILNRGTTSTASDVISSNITLDSQLNVTVGSTGFLALSGAISGANGFTKLGTGTLDISNVANNFVGTVNLNAGTIRAVTNDNVFGTANALVTTAGTTFNLNNTSQTFSSISGAGTISFNAVSGANRTLTVGGDNSNTVYTGTISGGASGSTTTMTKNGTGTFEVGGTTDNSSLRFIINDGKVIMNKNTTSGIHVASQLITINAGVLELGGTFVGGAPTFRAANYVDQIHYSAGLVMNGGTFDLKGMSENIDEITGTGGIITNSVADTESVLYIGADTASGSTAAQLIAGAGTLHLVKTSSGTQTFTAGNNFDGSIYIGRGGLTLSGANGAFTAVGNAGKTIEGLSTLGQNVGITLERESTLTFDNATNANSNRFNDDANVILGAGATNLRINGHASVATNETLGDVTVKAGNRASVLIDLNDTTPTATGLTLASLTREEGSTLQLRLQDNHATAWSTGLASVTLLDDGASLEQAGGEGAANTTNRSVAIGVTGGINNLADRLFTVDGNKLRPLDFTTEYQNFNNTTFGLFDSSYMTANPAGDKNVNITFGATVATGTAIPTYVSSSVAFNSFRISAESTSPNEFSRTMIIESNATVYLGGVAAGQDACIPAATTEGSGMLVFGRDSTGVSNSSNSQAIYGGTIDFGDREAIIINASGANALLRTTIAGNNGLIKSGSSNVYVDGTNTYSGVTRVNEGNLIIRSNKGLGNSTELRVEGSSGFYIGMGAEITGVDLLFTNRSSNGNALRVETGVGYWNGNIIIDNVDSSGDVENVAYLTTDTDRALFITGNIYGSDNAASTDAQTVGKRTVTTTNTANGVLNLRGTFSDKASGVASGQEVMNFEVNSTNEINVNIANAWKSAGEFKLRQGIVRYEGTGNFYDATVTTPNFYINPNTAGTGLSRLAAFLLSKDGQALNLGSSTVIIGSNGTRVDQSDTTIMLGTDMMTDGTVTLGALGTTWDLNPKQDSGLTTGNVSDIRFLATSGYNSETNVETSATVDFYGRVIDDTGNLATSETGSLTKAGRGTLRMMGSSSATNGEIDGGLNALAGTFEINYTTAGTNRTRFGGTSTAAPQLALGGGRVAMVGAATGGIVEYFGSLNVLRGGSEIASVSGTNTLSILAPTINRASSSALNFVDTNSAAEIRVGGADNTLIGYWATFNGEDFAFRTGTNDTVSAPVSGFYSSDTFATGLNTVVSTSGATSGNPTGSVKFTAAATVTGDLTVESGAILNAASNTGAVVIGTTGNLLATSASNDLLIHNYGSGGITVNSTLSGAQTLVIAGTGATTLTADSSASFNGKTSLIGGILSISNDNQLGRVDTAVADQLYLNGGTLSTTANVTLDANRGITLGGEGGRFDTAAGTTLTFSGNILGETFVPISVTNTPPNLAVGDLIKTGDGTLLLTGSGASNNFEGMIDVRKGTLRWAPTTTLATDNVASVFGSNRSWYDGTYVRKGATLEIAPLAGATGFNGNVRINEWISLEGGSTLRTQLRESRFNGLVEFKSGDIQIDAISTAMFGENGGYIFGEGNIIKTGSGNMSFNENSREWTGNLYVLRGSVDGRGINNPFGSGTGVIELGDDNIGKGAGYVTDTGNIEVYLRSENSAANVTTVDRSFMINASASGITQTKYLGARYGDHDDVFQFGAAGNPNGQTITLNDSLILIYAADYNNRPAGTPTNAVDVFLEFNANFKGSKNLSTRVKSGWYRKRHEWRGRPG